MAVANSCKEDFLEVTPNGALDGQVLATAQGVDALLIGAYAMLDGVSSNGFGWEAASSNWVYGSIRGMEANKGTDAGDQPDINPIQTFTETATNPYLDIKFRSVYEAISRCNSAMLVLINAESKGTVTAEQATSFRKQIRLLRGWYHFEAWRMWSKPDGTGIPYLDETTDVASAGNTEDYRPQIIADLTEGSTLPDNMGQIGRFNGTVGKVLLAKALMQMNKDYAAARTLLETVKTSGRKPDGSAIGLDPLYGDIFDAAKRNTSPENIYVIQYSVNDGSGGWNAGWGEVLNFPYKGGGGSPGGCCGFFQPNQELVNSYKTVGGLPLLDNSYNADPLITDQGVPVANTWAAGTAYGVGAIVTITDASAAANRQLKAYRSLVAGNTGNNPLTSPAQWALQWEEDTDPVDPRLDWAVGRRGIPYLDWGIHTGQDWIRDQSYAGPFSPKKQVYKKAQEGQLTEVGNWTAGWTANGYRFIRYADVLLMLAECQIETNQLADARTNINLVRARAANSAGFVKEADGTTDAANYVINEYPAAGAPFDNQANARLALRMERKLELAMEGHRYFDLQRWGIAQAELARILAYERTLRPTAYTGASVGAEDVNFPLPQRQIELNPNLVQNR